MHQFQERFINSKSIAVNSSSSNYKSFNVTLMEHSRTNKNRLCDVIFLYLLRRKLLEEYTYCLRRTSGCPGAIVGHWGTRRRHGVSWVLSWAQAGRDGNSDRWPPRSGFLHQVDGTDDTRGWPWDFGAVNIKITSLK